MLKQYLKQSKYVNKYPGIWVSRNKVCFKVTNLNNFVVARVSRGKITQVTKTVKELKPLKTISFDKNLFIVVIELSSDEDLPMILR